MRRSSRAELDDRAWPEMLVGAIAFAGAVVCAGTVLLFFRDVAHGHTVRFVPLAVDMAMVALAVLLGFAFGKLNESAATPDDLRFTAAYRELAEMARRQFASGSRSHVLRIAKLKRDTRVARLSTIAAEEVLWQASDSALVPTAGLLSSGVEYRFLQASLAGTEEPVELEQGRTYRLDLRIAPAVATENEVTPDSSRAEGTPLLIQIFPSENLYIAETQLQVLLPPTGPTSRVSTSVVPRDGENVRLRLLVLTQPQMTLLQEYVATVRVRRPEA